MNPCLQVRFVQPKWGATIPEKKHSSGQAGLHAACLPPGWQRVFVACTQLHASGPLVMMQPGTPQE